MQQINASMNKCKCCDNNSPLFGVCDFSKNCNSVNLKLTGIPIYYYKCQNCGFLFTSTFDAFNQDDFSKHIYNDTYIEVDPDFIEKRPNANANMLKKLLTNFKTDRTILDYGGGNGALAKKLTQQGFDIQTYDPFSKEFHIKPNKKFDLVVSFEVLEHVPNPKEIFKDMLSLTLADKGIILFSTLLQAKEIEKNGMNWWYIGPRNGHISIYTKKSLGLVLGGFGYKLVSFSQGLHVAYKQAPEFANNWFN